MWNKENEVKRIIALRQGAFGALKETGHVECTRDFVRLELIINLPRYQMKQNIGDLDNFITGVCDGLQAADSRAKIHPIFVQKV